MKRLLTALLVLPVMLYAQEPILSLQKAYELAQQNYPLIKQRELIKQTSEYSVDNLGKGFLPQILRLAVRQDLGRGSFPGGGQRCSRVSACWHRRVQAQLPEPAASRLEVAELRPLARRL